MGKKKVGIVGGTGYTGAELLRLIVGHPRIELSLITSRAEAGRQVSDLFPNLRGRVDLCFTEPDEAALRECELVFFATPNGTAMRKARVCSQQGSGLSISRQISACEMSRFGSNGIR